MKSIINVILISTILYSCTETKPCGKWVLGYSNDDGYSVQIIICDSLNMVSNKMHMFLLKEKELIYSQMNCIRTTLIVSNI